MGPTTALATEGERAGGPAPSRPAGDTAVIIPVHVPEHLWKRHCAGQRHTAWVVENVAENAVENVVVVVGLEQQNPARPYLG